METFAMSRKRAVAIFSAFWEKQNKRPFPFQRQAWKAFEEGKHGLIHSSTGTGKTWAAFMGVLLQELASQKETTAPVATVDGTIRGSRKKKQTRESSLKVLWMTPLRALAADTVQSLEEASRGLGLEWRIEKRTSDTSASERRKQSLSFPDVWVITPESCSVLLSYEELQDRFRSLRLIVVDEWHELLDTKRGVQAELVLARLRKLAPSSQLWALSATLAQPEMALDRLLGNAQGTRTVIRSKVKKKTHFQALLSEGAEKFPWSGHVGTSDVQRVIRLLRQARTSLVFTNTRSQTEIWYRAILKELPELAGRMAVHHGSLDQKVRWWVEDQLRNGSLQCCVCTSSLDLGIDFASVDQVIQIGSPKSVARMVQRAGRSGHQPNEVSRLAFVPTNAMEVLEYVALRDAIDEERIEMRPSIPMPLDVLSQHCVTMALGGGFEADDLLQEIRSTHTFQNLTEEQWKWVLDFIHRGGESLSVYPDFHRVCREGDRYFMNDRRLAARHRMSIGTIVSDAMVNVQYRNGSRVGMVEESFVSKLKEGDVFSFGGKSLQLVSFRDHAATVKPTKSPPNAIPRWMGGRLPLSSELAEGMRLRLDEASRGQIRGREMEWLRPLLHVQETWSAIPGFDEILMETLVNRDGHHLFMYPFEGRLVHEGMAAVLALRLSRIRSSTFTLAMNDYGLCLTSHDAWDWERALTCPLFTSKRLEEDILETLNASEMRRRQFREIARIAGLVFQGYPGQAKRARQLQASSNLFYDAFTQYDPDNLLFKQSRVEVLGLQLQWERLHRAMQKMESSRWVFRKLVNPSPFCFSLLVDRLRDRVSNESLLDRVRKMQEKLEHAWQP